MHNSVKAIVLTGSDSVNFAKSIFCPSAEQIMCNEKNFCDVKNSVTVTRDKNGFTAEIFDLELSQIDFTALNRN